MTNRTHRCSKRRTALCPVGLVGIAVVFVAASAAGAPEGIRLALPGDTVVVEVESYAICGLVPPGVDELHVRTPDGETTVAVDKGTFALAVDLSPGHNRFEIGAPGGESVSVDLFLDDGDETPPEGATRLSVHDFGVPDDIGDCGVCHPASAGDDEAWSRAQGKPETCAEACHEDVADHAHVHGPAAVGDCVACHNPHGSRQDTFLVVASDALCSRCHDTREEETGSVAHFPFEEGECAACHSPHGGENRVFFPAEEMGDVCFSCHDQDEMAGDSQHAPVVSGDCSMCHAAHASDHAGLLIEEQRTLCLDCHTEIGEMLELEFPHAAVEDECTLCHEPHSADAAPLLRAAPLDLCGDCHTDTTETAANAEYGHAPVEAGDCGTCHGVHGADHRHLLSKEAPGFCFDCHGEVRQAVEGKAVQHGPVADGDCGFCHGIHGSEFPRLLTAGLEPGFYTEYSEQEYEFCFQCHDQALVEEEKTGSATEFRDGERNLHYVHVRREKGRTCRACHDPHASDQEHLVRSGAPFGNWVIPIRYSVSENGGSCEVGCHRPQQYSR